MIIEPGGLVSAYVPEDIKRKTYRNEEEPFEDLMVHSLEDSDDSIVLNKDGKAVWYMPSFFHVAAVGRLLLAVGSHSTEDDPLDARKGVNLLVDKDTGRHREPDVSIWGRNRLRRVGGLEGIGEGFAHGVDARDLIHS